MFIKKDSVFNSFIYFKLLNRVIKSGNKTTFENLFFNFFFHISRNSAIQPIFFLIYSLELLRLPIELIKKKKGSRTYFIAAPVAFSRQFKLACKYFYLGLVSQHSKFFLLKLFFNIREILNHSGYALNYKKQLMKTALEGRAFRHFR